MPVETSNPKVIVIAGPNGAGKSTVAPELLQGTLAVTEFVNADVIARGLAAFDPESVSIQAGRIMLARLAELAKQRESFAFETTLASRTFATWIMELKKTGYLFHLILSLAAERGACDLPCAGEGNAEGSSCAG